MDVNGRQPGGCLLCGKSPTHARRLCNPCLQRIKYEGRLDQYPPVRPQCVRGMRASRDGVILHDHVEPCVDCGTTQGYRPSHSRSPRRSRGRCSECYHMWYKATKEQTCKAIAQPQ